MSLFLGIAEGWGTLSLVTGGAIAFGIKILDALRQLGQNKPQ